MHFMLYAPELYELGIMCSQWHSQELFSIYPKFTITVCSCKSNIYKSSVHSEAFNYIHKVAVLAVVSIFVEQSKSIMIFCHPFHFDAHF